MERFTEFEHEGWQRVADKYDSVWSSSTRQFIPPLLDAAEVSGKILDVGCGLGYVSAAAAERAWARKEENVFVQLVDDAIQAHANEDVGLPEGPPYYLFADPKGFQKALERAGFDGASMTFNVHTIEWKVPNARFIFEAELNAGVRTAGLLARQTSEALAAIQSAIEQAVRPYAKGDGFAIPKAASIIAVQKN